MNKLLSNWEWLQVAGVLGAALLTGLLLVRYLVPVGARWARSRKWPVSARMEGSVGRMVVLWTLMAGMYAIVRFLPQLREIHRPIGRVLLILSIFSATWIAARLAMAWVSSKTGVTASGSLRSASIISNITGVVIFAIGLMVVFQTLGISITPALTALGVTGLAVALALQDTLSNLFAGIQLIASRKLRPGDFIQIEPGMEGYIQDITWRNTTIQTLPNHLVLVPNAKLSAATVRNFTLPDKEIAVLVDLSVSHSNDLEKVERVTIDAARYIMQHTQGGVRDFEPFIRYHTVANYGVTFSVIMRGLEFTDQYLIKHEFIKKLWAYYRDTDIEIAFPIHGVFLRPQENGQVGEAHPKAFSELH